MVLARRLIPSKILIYGFSLVNFFIKKTEKYKPYMEALTGKSFETEPGWLLNRPDSHFESGSHVDEKFVHAHFPFQVNFVMK